MKLLGSVLATAFFLSLGIHGGVDSKGLGESQGGPEVSGVTLELEIPGEIPHLCRLAHVASITRPLMFGEVRLRLGPSPRCGSPSGGGGDCIARAADCHSWSVACRVLVRVAVQCLVRWLVDECPEPAEHRS